MQKSLDKTGIWVTTICALHCLFLPVLLPVLALVGFSFVGAPLFERVILAVSLLIGAIAMVTGFRHHRQVAPILLLALGGVLYWYKDIFGHVGEPILILAGAGLIVLGHVKNVRLTRACACHLPASDSQSVSAVSK
ncbi:MerC domain-containing protein [Pseudidiomarina taiwanensis]|uniref:MerC domain-containing protein n=1 Tax=Pseudidiomarina taiwanensis TaxID=337250 RepID=A0A432ZFW3_9GAMM|nr:MerC domain-containing protein [Pseudidiomarina taiwanensis]RUO76856.1 MerC domain-containing protein [Pseudidiomarina taiwanensis]